MAETVEADHNAAFWLPTPFLTDADDLDPRRLKKEMPKSFDLFSNGFDPFGPPSALDSPVSSSETEPEKDNRDDELLAELTRQLAQSTLLEDYNKSNSHKPAEKPWGFSTSPQSTLTGFGPWSNRSGFSSNGSPNGPSQVPSPTLTPPVANNDAAWELLYEAAGQVARLKMNAIAAQINHNQQQQNRGLIGGPCNASVTAKSQPINGFYDFPSANRFQAVKRQGSTMWAQESQNREDWYCQHHQPRRSCSGGALGLPQSAWPPLSGATQPHHTHPHHHHNRSHRQQGGGPAAAGMRAVFLGGSGLGTGSGPAVKKSAGTGVFLPRRPGTQQQPEPRRKPTGGSPVLLPARVVKALNLGLDDMNNRVNLNCPSRFACGFVTDHEVLMARKNPLMGQQRSLRRDGAATMVGHEVCLPSDWTY